MYNAVVKAFLILIWLSQFYSLISLVVWMNKNASDSRLNLRKIEATVTIQKIIMAMIFAFFAVDYVHNHPAGGGGAAPSLGVYALNCVLFLFIPAIFFLVLWKIKKRFLGRP
ncbi:MAG: hypothetical protein ACYDH3_05615 [Candidatus Aminicenantales bacterium]